MNTEKGQVFFPRSPRSCRRSVSTRARTAALRAVPLALSLIFSAMATLMAPKTWSSNVATSGAAPYEMKIPASSFSPRARESSDSRSSAIRRNSAPSRARRVRGSCPLWSRTPRRCASSASAIACCTCARRAAWRSSAAAMLRETAPVEASFSSRLA
jgi:hypothetical protein